MKESSTSVLIDEFTVNEDPRSCVLVPPAALDSPTMAGDVDRRLHCCRDRFLSESSLPGAEESLTFRFVLVRLMVTDDPLAPFETRSHDLHPSTQPIGPAALSSGDITSLTTPF